MGKPTKQVQPSRESLVEAVGGRVGKQIAAIIGSSLVLGFMFNASNPIGIRMAEPAAPTAAAPSSSSFQKAEPPPSPAPEPVTNTVVSAAPPPTPIISTPPLPASNAVAPTPAPEPQVVSNAPPVAQPAPLMALALPITWQEAKPLVASGRALLVDARAKHSFEASHIPGSVSLPESSTAEEIAAFQKLHPSSQYLVVYCGSQSCSLSKRLADRLVNQYGYTQVRYMTGGFQEWQRYEGVTPPESLPPAVLTTAKAVPQETPPSAPLEPPSAPPPAAPTIVVAPDATASPAPALPPAAMATPTTWVETKPLLQSGLVVLVDARPKAHFDAGHIPGAVSLPEASTPEEFAAFKEKVPPAVQVVVYCGSQSCSVSKRVADKLASQYGYHSVQYMTGGYLEWQKAEHGSGRSGS